MGLENERTTLAGAQRTYQCVIDSGNKTTGSMRLKNDGARAMLDENIGSNNELNNEKTLSIIKGD
jgi:lysine-specific demethylase 3